MTCVCSYGWTRIAKRLTECDKQLVLASLFCLDHDALLAPRGVCPAIVMFLMYSAAASNTVR